MKLILILSAMILFSCNDNKHSNTEMGKDVDPYRRVGIENVNGNVPDTTNTLDLSTKKTDSSTLIKDSLPH